jgi:hypothetical protein
MDARQHVSITQGCSQGPFNLAVSLKIGEWIGIAGHLVEKRGSIRSSRRMLFPRPDGERWPNKGLFEALEFAAHLTIRSHPAYRLTVLRPYSTMTVNSAQSLLARSPQPQQSQSPQAQTDNPHPLPETPSSSRSRSSPPRPPSARRPANSAASPATPLN